MSVVLWEVLLWTVFVCAVAWGAVIIAVLAFWEVREKGKGERWKVIHEGHEDGRWKVESGQRENCVGILEP